MSRYLSFFCLFQENGHPAPDGYFYYGVTIALASALIFIIWHFANKVTTTLDTLRVTVNELVSITKVHEVEINNAKKDIEELQQPKRKKQ